MEKETTMNQMWKFKVSVTGITELTMPKNAKIVHVDNQHDEICMWALVTPSRVEETRYFEVIGTGQNFGISHREYVGTVLVGRFVWHVFERV
jgi:hypothetical protein